MGTYPVPVDVEQLVISYLLGNAEAEAVLNTRIASKVPDDPVYPLATVHRFGGVAARQGWLARPRIQIDAWGETKKQAHDAAAAIYAALQDLPGPRALGVVTGVQDLLDLTWLPDPVTERPRYVQQHTVTLHPNP